MNREILAQLRNVLAALYPDESSIRRIITDAKINPALIPLSTSAINIWYHVLEEVEKTENLPTLLNVVEKDYGGNTEFQVICAVCRNFFNQIERNPNRFGVHPRGKISRRWGISQAPVDGAKHQSLQEEVLDQPKIISPQKGELLAQFTAIYQRGESNSREYRAIQRNGQHLGEYGLSISPNNEKVTFQTEKEKQVIVLSAWLEELANHKPTRRPQILLTIDESTKRRVYAKNPGTKHVKIRVASQGLREIVKGQKLTLECQIAHVSLTPLGSQKLHVQGANDLAVTFQHVEVELSVWYRE